MNTQSTSGFRVVLIPDLSEGVSREQALAALADRFGISREKAESYLGGKPKIIQKGLGQQQALQLQKMIKDCGLNCRLDWVEAQASTESPMKMEVDAGPVETGGASDLPSCPGCGYQAQNLDDPLITAFDGMGQCPVCHIIVAKYGKNDVSVEPATEEEPSPPGMNPVADMPFVPAKSHITSGGILSGNGKMFALLLGFVVVFFVGYFLVRSDSSSTNNGPSAGPGYSQNQYAAEMAKMAEDPTYVSPMVEKGPPPGAAGAAQQEQTDRIEALEMSGYQLGESWFDEAEVRIEPGEIWEGNISMKLPFETAYLDLTPHRTGNSVGDYMYRDMDLQVSENPWEDKGVRVEVTGQWVSGYDFNIWVTAEKGRVTGVLYPEDSSITLEALGQLSAMELREIEWSPKSNLPSDFDPVFDLVQGWGNGHKIEIGLLVEAPESLADYKLGRYVGSRAQTVALQDQTKGTKFPLTLAKKRGDSALYLRPGNYSP